MENLLNLRKTGYCLQIRWFSEHKKVPSAPQHPCPSILRGLVCFFLPFFIILLHNRPMNILQKIFKEHYEEMLYILHPRDTVIENVNKMINCGDPSFGGAMYGCSHCGELKFVPFRCHSRFCPTCGNSYCIDRSTNMSFKLIRCTHRHCVFTIDEELRHFFLEDRSLLDCLFNAARSVILEMFHKINKSKNFVPGFVCVLHTFGRSLQWNPHIHYDKLSIMTREAELSANTGNSAHFPLHNVSVQVSLTNLSNLCQLSNPLISYHFLESMIDSH